MMISIESLDHSSNDQTKTDVERRTGAGNETRTRDPNLGKVVLYQLSYSRMASPRGVEPLLPP